MDRAETDRKHGVGMYLLGEKREEIRARGAKDWLGCRGRMTLEKQVVVKLLRNSNTHLYGFSFFSSFYYELYGEL